MNQKAKTAWTLQTLEIFIDHKAVNIKAPRILCVYASSMSEDLDFLLLCSMERIKTRWILEDLFNYKAVSNEGSVT